ncbi:uncharacterized protein LOC136755386 isoform X2 [Amia ocellicauda]|uniref:uncharacterized protein LOC136755386 isoform X2 n=1 Tax=Amia ocellicauda TaxID=2972642 RepID=UPI003464CC2E
MDTFKTQLAGILEILVRAAVCEVSSLMERRAGDSVMAFQDKLASLSEILARAAVREITQLTDERFVESCRGFSRAKSRGAPPEPSLQRPDNGAACAGQTPCVQTRCVGVQVSLGITGAQSQATTKGPCPPADLEKFLWFDVVDAFHDFEDLDRVPT